MLNSHIKKKKTLTLIIEVKIVFYFLFSRIIYVFICIAA